MNRIIAMFLVVILSLGCVVAEADTSIIDMETGLTNSMAQTLEYPSAKVWMSDSTYRAMISVALLFDYTVKLNSEESDSYKPSIQDLSYVARDGSDIYVAFANEEKDKVIVLVYTPSNNEDNNTGAYCEYTPSEYDYTVNSFLDVLLESIGPDGYYKNDKDDMNEVLSVFQEIAAK